MGELQRGLRHDERLPLWPLFAPEPGYAGQILLVPQAGPPPPHTVFRSSGGAAAVMPTLRKTLTCRLPAPQSSTQCELVALSLAARFTVLPELILTDSLCSLQLISSWPLRSSASVMYCPQRVDVRRLLFQWKDCASPPTLEKVKAHDEVGHREANAKTLGNERADALAKEACERASK